MEFPHRQQRAAALLKENHLVVTGYGKMSSSGSGSSSGLKRKVVILGAPSVGKTSLTQQYVAPPTYNEAYFPTIEATSHKTITYSGQEYECEIIDSAGQVSRIAALPWNNLWKDRFGG